jgi:hypothetical protein
MKSITFSVGDKVWIVDYSGFWEIKEGIIERFDIEDGYIVALVLDEPYFLCNLCQTKEQAEIQLSYKEDFK